jgi:hypothetical protein
MAHAIGTHAIRKKSPRSFMISPPPSSKMLKFAAVCALVAVVTTLAVHVLPQLWADVDTFEERLELSHNPIYMARLWVVLVHCGLIVVSMFGIAALKFSDSPALIGLGFLSFVVFAFSEMLRTSLVLFALNRKWRVGYSEAKDQAHALRCAPRSRPLAESTTPYFLFSTLRSCSGFSVTAWS